MRSLKRPGVLATVVLVLLVAGLVLCRTIDPEVLWTRWEINRALRQGVFGLEAERELLFTTWLRELRKREVLGPYSLNQPWKSGVLNIYTERSRKAWFNTVYDAVYLPSINAIAISRDTIEAGVMPFSDQSRTAYLMFLLLHEIGHSQPNQRPATPHAFSDYDVDDRAERRADCFAAAYLDRIDFVDYDDSDVIWPRNQLVRRMLGSVNADWYFINEREFNNDRVVRLQKFTKKLAQLRAYTTGPKDFENCLKTEVPR